MSFKITKKTDKTRARCGLLQTNHGQLETPFFMPIGTRGAVKTIGTDDLEEINASILLSNTFHLMLRPGTEIIKAAGDLHGFMNWQRPILTDSGGYQVFSLTHLRKLTEDGVSFASPYDGSEQFLSPERSMEVQNDLGSDIVMAFDECTEFPVEEARAKESMELTGRWAGRSKEHYAKIGGRGLLFGIVQGSIFSNLREQSAKELIDIGFDGYAIGGLSIGEPREETYKLVEQLDKLLPEDKPRYFMGAGKPEEIVEYVRRGIDMFDCVMPTRNARHGLIYKFTDHEKSVFENSFFYETIHITNEKFKSYFSPIDSNCKCPTCQRYSMAYIRHLFAIEESLGWRLATIHNLFFYTELLSKIRKEI